jgi:hypothetical protein
MAPLISPTCGCELEIRRSRIETGLKLATTPGTFAPKSGRPERFIGNIPVR